MTTIYLAGDSTTKQNSILTYPQTGIGQMLSLFIRPEIQVQNHAENGRSTKSFLDEGRLATIYDRIDTGDFLFVQFSHNDEKAEDPERYTDPDGEFCENLERFVNAARNKGAIPVLITPVARRLFASNDARYAHEGYRQAVIRTAKRLDTAYIDLNTTSEALVSSMGDASKDLYMIFPANTYEQYPDGSDDNTHLRPEGARKFAALIAKGLHDLGGVYAALLVDGLHAPSKEESK